MTCQWCTGYRRRGGVALCVTSDPDGSAIDANTCRTTCPRFEPRRICTTCSYRCSSDERDRLVGESGECPRWRLRELSRWGGARNFGKAGGRRTRMEDSTKEDDMNMKNVVAAAMAAFAGCAPHSDTNAPVTDVSGGKTRYLCVGMETSYRFGECPGCEKDANCMTKIFHDELGYSGTTLISKEATKSRVVSLLKKGISETPEDGLFIFTYSGHGGQERLGGQEPDGADAPDEYLCLYDTYMQDDEIWDIVSKCKGRVFLYFDACHSATMFRSVRAELEMKTRVPAVAYYDSEGNPVPYKAPEELVSSAGFTFRLPRTRTFTASRDGSVVADDDGLRLLCWSGCKEAESSYGGSTGGVLTQAVMKYWKKGETYANLWKKARGRVVNVQVGQNPVATNVGGGFEEDVPAFE